MQRTQVCYMFCKHAAGKLEYLIKVCLFYIWNTVILSIMEMCLLLQASVVSSVFSTNIIFKTKLLAAFPARLWKSSTQQLHFMEIRLAAVVGKCWCASDPGKQEKVAGGSSQTVREVNRTVSSGQTSSIGYERRNYSIRNHQILIIISSPDDWRSTGSLRTLWTGCLICSHASPYWQGLLFH